MRFSDYRKEVKGLFAFLEENCRNIPHPKQFFTRIISIKTYELFIFTSFISFLVVNILFAIMKQSTTFIEIIYSTMSYAIISLRFLLIFFGAFYLLRLVSISKLILLSCFLSIIYTSFSYFIPYLLVIMFLRTEIYFFYYLSNFLSILVVFYFVIIMPLIVNERFKKFAAVLLTVIAYIITSTVTYSIITNTNKLNKYLIIDPIQSEYMEKDVLNESKSRYLIDNQIIIAEIIPKMMDEDNFSNPFFQNELISQIESLLTIKPELEELLTSLKFNNNKKLINLNIELLKVYEQLLFELKKIQMSEFLRLAIQNDNNIIYSNALEKLLSSLKILLQSDGEDNVDGIELIIVFNSFLESIGETTYQTNEPEKVVPVIIERLREMSNNHHQFHQQLQQDLIIANNYNLAVKNINSIFEKLDELALQIDDEISRLNQWLIMKNRWAFLGL